MTESHPADDAGPGGDGPRRPERPDRFAAMLAHDLRNPLTVARGRLALAREESDSEHLDALVEAHERIDQILEDYLALARRGSMAVDLGPVDLAAVAEASWRHVATHEATLDVDTDRVIRADADRVRQLLENLVRNAVEHGGRDVTVTVGDVEDGFYVADDGPGFQQSEDDVVPDVDPTSPGGEGGIGLSIVSTIAEVHGWGFDVIDADGARFEFTGVTFAD